MPNVTPLGAIKKKNDGDSSDYTSDEDFDFIDNMLNGPEGRLDAMTLKMLRGIVQPAAKERKRDLKPDYINRRKRRRGGPDDSVSDSVDEYGDEEGAFA